MKTGINLLICILFISLQKYGNAQCDSLANRCQKHITSNYISDGQTYRALLSGDDTAEFQAVLFEGNTYRIAACSGSGDGNLIFRIVDQERNIMFNSSDYNGVPYWDFYIENTLAVTIEAMLDANKSESGCATIVLGFKK